MMASFFAVAQVPAGLGWSALTRRVPLRGVLALAGLSVALGVTGMTLTATSVGGGLTSAVFGAGVSGLHLLLRLTWAEYYGRQHLGTLQGVTLPVQLLGQALGPVLSGVLFDRTGRYEHAFLGLAGLVLLGSLLVLSAVPPQQPDRP
jgi:cyanate permease